MPQVNILIGNEFSGVMMLFHVRYPNDVLFAIEGSFANFKGGREGTVSIGQGSGVKNWSVGPRIVRN